MNTIKISSTVSVRENVYCDESYCILGCNSGSFTRLTPQFCQRICFYCLHNRKRVLNRWLFPEFHLFQDRDYLEVFPPNITKPYREVSECHNRWQKPPPRKKPGDGEDPASSDWNVLDQVYKTITLHDSSRLNTAVWATPCSLVVISYMITIIW